MGEFEIGEFRTQYDKNKTDYHGIDKRLVYLEERLKDINFKQISLNQKDISWHCKVGIFSFIIVSGVGLWLYGNATNEIKNFKTSYENSTIL